MNTTKVKYCHLCKTAFDCAVGSVDSACWCHDFPPIFNPFEGGDCLCPNCFIEKMDEFVKGERRDGAVVLPGEDPLIKNID